MKFSYTGNPLTSTIDAVRLEIGDTLANQHEVEDEEILYAYSKEGTVVKAAARIAEMLAARYAKREDFRAGGIQSVKTTMSAKFATMARRLRARGVRAGSFIAPSTSVAAKQETETDTDSPPHAFKRGLHDNPDVDEDTDDLDTSITGGT